MRQFAPGGVIVVGVAGVVVVVAVVVDVVGSPPVDATGGGTTDAGGKAERQTGMRVGSPKRADVGSGGPDGRTVVVGIGGPITGVAGGRVVVGRVGSGGSVVVVVDVVVATVAAVGGTVGCNVMTGLPSCCVAGAEEAVVCIRAKIDISGKASAAAIQTKRRNLTAIDPRRHIPTRMGIIVKLSVCRCPPPVPRFVTTAP